MGERTHFTDAAELVSMIFFPHQVVSTNLVYVLNGLLAGLPNRRRVNRPGRYRGNFGM